MQQQIVPKLAKVKSVQSKKKTPKKNVKIIERVKAVTRNFSDISKNASNIAKSITNPMDYPCLRWASSFSDDPTAVAAPFRRTNTLFGTNSNAIQLPITDSVSFAFRCAERANIIYDPNVGGLIYNYALFNNGPISIGGSLSPVPTNAKVYLNTVNAGIAVLVPTAYLQATSSYQPNTNITFCGSDGVSPARYFWMNPNDYIQYTVSSQAAGAIITVNLNLWTPSVTIPSNYQQFTTCILANTNYTGVVANGSVGGYYSLSVSVNTSNNIVGFFANTYGTSSVMCHLPINGYFSNVGSVDAIRIYAVSQMYSNDASLLNRQGKVASYQASGGKSWTDYVSGGYKSVAGSLGSAFEIADVGQYCWMKPIQPSDFNMLSNVDVSNGVILDSHYPLLSASSFLVTYVTITNSGGQDGQWTLCHGIEYKTDDVWRSIDTPMYSTNDTNLAFEVLKHVPQFTENPMHISQIWNAIKNGAKGLLSGISKYGPAIGKAADLLLAA